MMTAPLILRDRHATRHGEQDAVIMLNDFTMSEAAAVLAELHGKGEKAMAGMGAPKRGPTAGMGMPEA
jgi:hypothetical protein